MSTGSVTDTRRSGHPSNASNPEVAKKKCLFIASKKKKKKRQFDKQQGKVATPFAMYKLYPNSNRGLSSVYGSLATVKHYLLKIVTFLWNLEDDAGLL